MKKEKRSTKSNHRGEEIRNEYKIDYRKSRPNRFAKIAQEEPLVVMVDADVAGVFRTSEAVNQALRALIAAIPDTPAKRVNR
ncbi:MAG TPA: hypothetical protein VEL78_04520 [Pyrinomonadaceae bacterium]|nr:hypothetical protein [Pyrinomonadaceae bacterium]